MLPEVLSAKVGGSIELGLQQRFGYIRFIRPGQLENRGKEGDLLRMDIERMDIERLPTNERSCLTFDRFIDIQGALITINMRPKGAKEPG